MPRLLELNDLHVEFSTDSGTVKAVDGVSYGVDLGETLAIVGESGCGKSVSALSIMGLLPKPAGKVLGGQVLFNGADLLTYSNSEMRRIRGREIAMVFQEPMTSLNPLLTIGRQLTESLELHMGMDAAQARTRVLELMDMVEITDAPRRLSQYPHHLSGGMMIGITSAYVGGKFDLVVQRFVDTMMGFPGLVVVLIMVVALGPSLFNVTLAIAVNYFDKVIRLARSSALSVKEEQYVLAATAVGARTWRIIYRYITPNSLAPVFVLATQQLGTAIVIEASLSFLGLGVQPPNPSWGNMLQAAAKSNMELAPWLAIFPGAALALVTFSFAVFGDALRDVLDPRMRGT